ncbi:hypothetical protein ACTJIJ_09405 [Niabella sp. 22666]|uniref:hypothetical protein n=1 Tax=Niabella sp. 22666 TaxID=3453954 RepID=UPI003F842AE9
MFEEIVSKYEKFSDALISKVRYLNAGVKTVEVLIRCMNHRNDYQFETIKLIFVDIVRIQFFEIENQSSTVINAALITNTDGIISFDFFPLIYDSSKLVENENSDFMIKCREIRYIQVANN